MFIRKLALNLIVPAATLAAVLFGASAASAASAPVDGLIEPAGIAATTTEAPLLPLLGSTTDSVSDGIVLAQWGPPPPRWRRPYWRRPYYRRPAPGWRWRRHVNWCLQRYRTYNPRTNRYRGYDGYLHRCRSPWR